MLWLHLTKSNFVFSFFPFPFSFSLGHVVVDVSINLVVSMAYPSKMMDGMFSNQQASSPSAASGDLNLTSNTTAKNRLANSDCHLPATSLEADSVDRSAAAANGHNQRGGSPDDAEKEERRRVAKKVLGKHG